LLCYVILLLPFSDVMELSFGVIRTLAPIFSKFKREL